MRLQLAAIGRLKSGAEKTLVDEYLQRTLKLGRNAGISDLTMSDFQESAAATATLRKSDEAKRLLASCPHGSAIIALDENGKNLTSKDFAELLVRMKDSGIQSLSILIGGPDGHEASLLSQADHKLALGKMTWPHRLARIMIAEQLYRAVTIMLNHPYHRK